MVNEVPVLNKVLGPMFTVEVAPFQSDASLPMEAMYVMEVGVRGVQLNPTGGYVRRSGAGDPSPTLGNNNDLYFDTESYNFWQKFSTTWTLIGNLQGPQGVQGPGGNNLLVGTDSVDPLDYPEGTVLINPVNGDVFEQVGGTWVLQGNIMGPAGPTGDTGPAGADGIIGADGADGLSITWMGTYNSGSTYNVNDAVEYNGSSYICILDGTTGDPESFPARWDFLAQKGSDGTTGSAGTDGADGIDGKTVLNGAGTPSNGLGVDGDFYINTSANTIYGPKTSGVWGSPTSLVGPTGATGAAGTNGTSFPAKSVNSQTGTSYTLQNSDLAGNVVLKMNNASAITLTVNTGLTGVEPVHVLQYGAGQITISGSATIRYAMGLKSRAQYSAFSLIPIDTNEYLAVGDMSA